MSLERPLLLLLLVACGDKADTGDDPDTGGADTGPAEADCDAPATWFYDADGDGYGVEAAAVSACDAPPGYTDLAGDCDDIAAEVHPGVAEVCDGLDNDCDGEIDPLGSEGEQVWFPDADADGFGVEGGSVTACASPSGFVDVIGDCDDTNADAFPGAPEDCGDPDLDCDGATARCELPPDGTFTDLGYPFIEGDQAGGSLGRSVSSADLDGDGVHDLIAGGYLYGAYEGSAFVAHGPLSGTVLVEDLPRVSGDGNYEYVGFAVAGVPDLDGDGYDELAVGGPGVAEGGPGGGVGAVYLFRGPLTAGAGELRGPDADAVMLYSPTRSNVGSTLWAGDVDGDGVAELLVGADTADATQRSGFWALDGHLLADGLLDSLGPFFAEDNPGDRAGEELKVVPDTDGDGLDDVLVTSLTSDAGSTDGGTVSLFLGAFPVAGGTVGDADAYLDGETSYGFLGQALAGGDLDGDGYGEIVVGAYDDSRFADYGGVAYVFSGPFDPTIGLAGARVTVHGTATSGRAANGLAVQDLDSDGSPELVVTYTAANANAGGVLVYAGPVAAGTYEDGDADRTWSSSTAGDGFLLELEAVGDLTGDGHPDIAFGLPSWSGGDQRGAVVVLPSL